MKNKSVTLVEKILLYAALFFVIVRFILERYEKNDVVEIFSWVTVILVAALVVFKLLFWVFPKWFKNKPTLSEIEEKQFGNKE